jgi:hypothetical protein
MRRVLLIASACAPTLTLAALATAHTGHGTGERPRIANIDGGPDLERVLARSLCEASDGTLSPPQGTSCAAGTFPRHRIELDDTCAGQPRSLPLSTVQDFVARLRVTDVDGNPTYKEVFLDVRSGATGRGGESRLVRMRGDGSGGCPRAESLFRYPSRATAGRLPRRAVARSSWDAEVRDYTRRFRGKEVRLLETYVDRNDPYCCPTFLRASFFRLPRGRDHYLRFRTEVRKIKG